MACASAIVALAGWQYWALGEPSTAEHRIALGNTSPATIDGPGEPPLPGSQPFEVFEQLPYFPPALFPAATNHDELRQPAPDLIPDTTKMVEAATARVNAEGGQLTREEMIAVLRAAGAPEEWIPDMLTIAWCESHYSPGAVGDSGNSLGLFQLWSGWAQPGEDLFDALTNARVAVRVRDIRGRFGGGGGWSCATNNGIP